MSKINNKYLRKNHFQFHKQFRVYWKKLKANPDPLYLFVVPMKTGEHAVYLLKDTEKLTLATTDEEWFDELDTNPRKIVGNKLDMKSVLDMFDINI